VPEITFDKLFLIAVFLLVGFPIHEFSHAYAAYRLGDGTAKMFGRLTLNPIAHFDMLGGLILIISILFSNVAFGWAKPTPVNPNNLRDRRNGEVIVALAGPASNLVLASLTALAIRLIIAGEVSIPLIVAQTVFLFGFYNLALAVFNLIPVPPLDGGAVLFRFLPAETAWRIRPMLTRYGAIGLFVGIFLLARPLGAFLQNAWLFLVGA
jgi:Zn-dependent protease